MHYPLDDGGSQGPFCPLDNNHSHFILVEPGSPGKGDGPTELRLRLEKYISEQRTGYGGESARGAGQGRGERRSTGEGQRGAVHGGGAARGGGGAAGNTVVGVAGVVRAEEPPAWAGTGIPATKHARVLRPGPLGGPG